MHATRSMVMVPQPQGIPPRFGRPRGILVMGKMPSFKPARSPAPAARRAAPGLLSVPAVAERLDVSVKTVRRMIDAGELPAHRVGRLVRVSADDLLVFLARCRFGVPVSR
ncbi:helix-turn-helix domain-containing protein [Paracraurococcus ruber]|uniref:helix-turn-helix domain-containing protein n=1 Tax=Paracraurococcus ruber TaxID=77675 RepID=UPI00195F6328|nr:helix-turn-helix domain-containing protein [Paracraurococcus ruber]